MHESETESQQEDQIDLSVVVPIYNEERYIVECVLSLMRQDYPMDKVEILLVDGCSTDSTPLLLEKLKKRYPDTVKTFTNPDRIQSCAMNIGMSKARGKYIMRIDAHAEYPDTYFKTCTSLLEQMGAENVGCAWSTSSKTEKGRLIAKMLSTSFAVGGSSFRVDAPSGYVDTVPFGTFKTSFLKKIGGFDERLARSEDNEINYRIRKQGGKIYLTNQIHTVYYCRDSISSLGKMAFENGKWNVIATFLCPGSMSVKYYVPLIFVLSLVMLPLLSIRFRWCLPLLTGELFVYLSLAMLSCYSKTHRFLDFIYMIWLFPIFHIMYGIGSIAGIVSLHSKMYIKK